VDIAAGQLLVRECGLAIDLVGDGPLATASLDLVARARVVAAGTDALVASLSAALVQRIDQTGLWPASSP
jgi:fructose-1,6-bisphosphatase/inositol monophosphatase family enzyme